MIRIDEIYYNVFVKSMQGRMATMHWFDPFGTTEIENLCSAPIIDDVATRILFWDQEPLHQDRLETTLTNFFESFQDPVILVTSEKNSEQVSRIRDTYGIRDSYYFFHGWAALDWYRGYNRTFLSIPFRDRKIQHTFLCPNNIVGGRRTHRLELLSELVDRELIKNNLISFPDICPYEKKSVAQLCIENNIHMGSVDLPLTIDRGVDYGICSHKIDMWNLSNKSLLHVVTETLFHGQRWHLTEKTFKPIVLQQPFVLVSCRGSLEYIRQYGFKTFSDIWDESYDEANDDVRILKIGKLLHDLDSLSNREKSQLQKHLAPIVEHNFCWFYSREFETLLWDEMTNMIKQW